MAHVTANQPVARAPSNSEQQKETLLPVETAEVKRRFPVLSRFAQHVPTLMVMGLLAGLGAYGHHSGWKLPKFSALVGSGVAEREDWCEEHEVPESQCVECRPDLLPRGKDYGWCKEHGVHNCPLCHLTLAPSLAGIRACILVPAGAGPAPHYISFIAPSAPRQVPARAPPA